MKNLAVVMLLPTLMLANEVTASPKDTNSTLAAQETTNLANGANQPATAKTTETTKESDMTNTTENNIDAAAAFLVENAKKEGVVSLNENLQYKILENGEGPMPNMHSSVTVHYEGSLLDGTEFDSSFKRNEPATFNLDQVIQGWTEVLPHMKTGSTWLVYIGPELAYGERGIPGTIPPNSVLVFKIQLLKVNS